jgi:hypothetical protein
MNVIRKGKNGQEGRREIKVQREKRKAEIRRNNRMDKLNELQRNMGE